MRGFLWATEVLVFTDFHVAHPHAHGALQLSVGIEGSPRLQLDGAWRRARGVLIDTDVAHAFDSDGQLTAIGWIEGESRIAEQLRDRVLQGRPYAVLPEPLCEHLADGLRPVPAKTAGCPEMYQRWRDALGQLAVDVMPEPPYDDRITAVLDHICGPHRHHRRRSRTSRVSHTCQRAGSSTCSATKSASRSAGISYGTDISPR